MLYYFGFSLPVFWWKRQHYLVLECFGFNEIKVYYQLFTVIAKLGKLNLNLGDCCLFNKNNPVGSNFPNAGLRGGRSIPIILVEESLSLQNSQM